MRKLSIILLISVMVLGILPTAALADQSIKINVDGRYYLPYPQPVIEEGIAFVPLHSFMQNLYAFVDWQEEEGIAVIKKDQIELKLTMDETAAEKNGEQLVFSAAPKLIEEVPFVPLRDIAEALGAVVTWDQASHTVVVETVEYRIVPELLKQAGEKMQNVNSLDYTNAFTLESGGLLFKGTVFGSYHKEKTFSVHFASAFYKWDVIVDGDTVYYRFGKEKDYNKETFDLPIMDRPIDYMLLFQTLVENFQAEPYTFPSGEKGKKLSFDLNKDKILEFVARNMDNKEETLAELQELVEANPDYKRIFETLHVRVSLLLHADGYVKENETTVIFQTDSGGYGQMMDVKTSMQFSYSKFNEGTPIAIPTEDELYDPFMESLQYMLKEANDAVKTYHFAKGKYPTRDGKADGIVDYSKLIQFSEDIFESDDDYNQLFEDYNEKYGESEDPPFYISFIYSVPSSSYYVRQSLENVEADDRAVIYYVDKNGDVAIKMQTEPGSGQFADELIYLKDLEEE